MRWKLTDHVCKACLGRVLECRAKDGKGPMRLEYRCADCGKVGLDHVGSVCCCGDDERVDPRTGQVVNTGRSLGLECVRNPNPTPDVPTQVLVRQRSHERAALRAVVLARVEVVDQV